MREAHEFTRGSSHRPNQYENPANPRIHEEATGAEIWEQTDGEVTHFVAGVGTGGTITGVSRALHDHGDVRTVGYEPERPAHTISGLRYARGVTFDYPGVFDADTVDVRREVDSEAARRWARWIRERTAGDSLRIHDPGQHDVETVREHLQVDDQFLVGPSSGGTIAALHDHAMTDSLTADDVVVVLFADRGDRYTSFPAWAETWDVVDATEA